MRETMGSLPPVENDEYKKKAGRSPSSVPHYPPYTQAEGSNLIFDTADIHSIQRSSITMIFVILMFRRSIKPKAVSV